MTQLNLFTSKPTGVPVSVARDFVEDVLKPKKIKPRPAPPIDLVKKKFIYNEVTGEIRHRDGCPNKRLEGRVATWETNRGYLCVSVMNENIFAHRIAWLLVFGTWPDVVDHINGIKNDNRLANLREATASLNYANVGRRKHNTSGFKGVTRDRGNAGFWRAQISYGGRTRYLGRFSAPDEAHAAYMKKAVEVFGEFARAT